MALACGRAPAGCVGLVPSWAEGWTCVLLVLQEVASTSPTWSLRWPSLWPPPAQPAASSGSTCGLCWPILQPLPAQPVASTGPTCSLYQPNPWPPLARPVASDHLGRCGTVGARSHSLALGRSVPVTGCGVKRKKCWCCSRERNGRREDRRRGPKGGCWESEPCARPQVSTRA